MRKMKKTKALRNFLTDDQILEVLIKFETRKVEACGMLKEMIFDKWQITTLQAMGILQNIQKEWNG